MAFKGNHNKNNLLLNKQQSIISCLCKGKMSHYFTYINYFLLLFLKIIKTSESRIIVINSDNDEQYFDEIDKEIQVSSFNFLNSPDLNSL